MEEKIAFRSRASLVIDEEMEDEHTLLLGMIGKSLADEEKSSKSDIVCRGSVIFHPDQGVPKILTICQRCDRGGGDCVLQIPPLRQPGFADQVLCAETSPTW